MCLYTYLGKNKKYTPTKKNKGIIPQLPINPKTGRPDTRVLYAPVACGQCIECLKQKANGWRVRMIEELKNEENERPQFATLTFNTESLKEIATRFKSKGYELDNDIAIKAMELFMGIWRKHEKKEPKRWWTTEIGGDRYEHIHIHAIIWTNDKNKITKYWKHGYVFVGEYVNLRTINYIVKYCTKKDIKHKHYKPIIRASKGIGKNYTNSRNVQNNKYKENETDSTYRTNTGHRIMLPTYLKNKIYTDDEKEKMWIEQLNKEERTVLGTKIDISKNEVNYLKAVKEARRLNNELGYGGQKNKKKEKEDEEKRRNIIQETRGYGNENAARLPPAPNSDTTGGTTPVEETKQSLVDMGLSYTELKKNPDKIW